MRVMFIRALLCLTLISISASSENSVLGSASSALTRGVAESLPGEILVIYTQPGEVYLDITREKGASVGKKYVIERPGEEIRHPVTGDVLGRAGVRIAEVQITWVQQGFSRAKVLSLAGDNAIHVKDIARPSEQPIVLRLPLRHPDGTFSKLTEQIDAEIALALSNVPGATLRVGPAVSMSSEGAASFSTTVPEAAIAVAGRIVNDKVELSVINVAAGKVASQVNFAIPDSCRSLASEKVSAAPVVVAPSGSSPRENTSMERVEFKEVGEISAPLEFVPIDMTAGDIDGDGIDEIIFVDNRTVRISKLKLDGTLSEIAKVSVGWASQIFHIDAGDIDHDGIDEIYVVEKPGNFVRSAGYRFVNGKLERFFKGSGVFLRVVRSSHSSSADGDVLYGQAYGSSRPFHRNVLRYRFSGDKKELESVSAGLPSNVTLFDFAVLGTSGFVAALDFESKLKLYSSTGDAAWTSQESYGGSDVRLESADKRNATELHTGIEAVDIDGDGVPEIVAVQNLLDGGMLPGFVRIGALQQYRNGRIVALSLSGTMLVERWKTKTYSGIIKGYSIANALGRGPEAVFFSLEKLSFTSKRATLRSVPLGG